jgi:CO/xanthine dehydrogenase FAD-binding subunit
MTRPAAPSFLLPATLSEALELKATHGERARFVAGGTDLLLQVRAGRHSPDVLIRLPLTAEGARLEGDRLVIPARTPLRTLEQDPLLLEHAPLLAEAIGQIGSPQIRNAGTLGGNLGNASPAADSAPPLLVYGAAVHLRSPGGEREVAIGDFFTGPGRTVVGPDEVIDALSMPVPEGTEVGFFRKFGPRGANVISSANFAARIRMREGKVEAAFLAAGSVAPRPIRLVATEQALAGRRRREFDQEAARTALAQTLRAEVAPISDVRGSAWYKAQVVERCFEYLLEQVRPN